MTEKEQIQNESVDVLEELREKPQIYDPKNVPEYNISAASRIGVNEQAKLGGLVDEYLKQVNADDMEGKADYLLDLKKKMSNMPSMDDGFFDKIFRKMSIMRKIENLNDKYVSLDTLSTNIAVNINQRIDDLKTAQIQFTAIQKNNDDYLISIDKVIDGLKVEIEKVKNDGVPNNYPQKMNYLNVLTKRQADLMTSREIISQQIPQIQASMLANIHLQDSLRNSINLTVPILKQQLAISINNLRQRYAAETQKQLNQATEEAVKNNVEQLEETLKVSQEASTASMVSPETLRQTHAKIDSIIDDYLSKQQDTSTKQQQLVKELEKIQKEGNYKKLDFDQEKLK